MTMTAMAELMASGEGVELNDWSDQEGTDDDNYDGYYKYTPTTTLSKKLRT